MTGCIRAISPNQLSASTPDTHPDQQTAYAECLHADGLVMLQESIHCCDRARTGSTAVPGGCGQTGTCTKKPITQHPAPKRHKRHNEPTLAIGVLLLYKPADCRMQCKYGKSANILDFLGNNHTHTMDSRPVCMQSAQTLLPPVHLLLFLLKAKIMGRQFFSNINLQRFCSLTHGSAVSQLLLFGYGAGDNEL